VTWKLWERREPRSASMYSLGLSPLMSLDHLQSTHSALCVPRSLPTRHLPAAEFTALLYQLWAQGSGGEKYTPVQTSFYRRAFDPTTWYGMHTRIVIWLLVSFRRRLPDNHPHRRPPLQDWQPGRQGGSRGSDFNVKTR